MIRRLADSSRRKTRRTAGRLARCGGLAMAVSLAAMSPALAQLGPGDLQRAHALTANAAGWVALRGAVRAVVEALDIGEPGAEAETTDTLAVLLGLEDGAGQLDAILTGAARGALIAFAAPDQSAAQGFADNGLTLARSQAIARLIFGHAPEDRSVLADALELSEEERAYWPEAYAKLRDYWLPTAASMRAVNAGPGAPATVELTPAGGAMASARAVLIAGRTLDEVAAFVSEALASPRPLTIRAARCEDGASPPADDEIRVCYELVGAFASGIERGIVAGR